jgi:hypothetical protein
MEEVNLLDIVWEALKHYSSQLDWGYIFTLIIIAHYLTKDEIIKDLPFSIRGILVRIPTTWRVIIIGCIYGVFVYYIRGYKEREGVEMIVQSLFFSIVAHKLFLANIIKKFDL